MSFSERAGSARLWTRFLIEEFSNHFLDVDEAVKLADDGAVQDFETGVHRRLRATA